VSAGSPATIALLGDYSPQVIAHQAIPRALELARAETGAAVAWRWVLTRDLRVAAEELAEFAGVWVVPGSPYANEGGVLAAIQFARETGRPFLGTCGGFQHALIEIARHVAGLREADHAEIRPNARTLVVTPLSCSLVEKTGDIRVTPGSRLHRAYGRDTAHEGYHCNYGVNPAHRATLEAAGLNFTAFDAAGDIRAAELPASAHPFFIGTLFQPERTALRGEVPPVVRAFVDTVAATASRPPSP
jgi:CTP synthase (UTP-ammonia lyase)